MGINSDFSALLLGINADFSALLFGVNADFSALSDVSHPGFVLMFQLMESSSFLRPPNLVGHGTER